MITRLGTATTSYTCRRSVSILSALFLTSTACCAWVVQAGDASSPTVGLRNLGNTCYMNAQLQCAYHIPLVRRIITTTATTEKETVSPGLAALSSVFADMQAASSGRAVSPAILARVLGIPVLEQQDSQEFWKLLLPALQSPSLTDLYQGAFEDYIVAQDGSGRERRREEGFLDISLDILPTPRASSVQASLAAAFGQAEMLRVAEGNGWRPEKGADKVDALKGSRLQAQGLPAILQLHLKRFTYDWNRDLMEKNNDPFAFEDTLDLSALCKEESGNHDIDDDHLVYDLQAVVIHVGTFHAGHYYAYVRPDVTENRWFRINDEAVNEVPFAHVLADAVGGKVKDIRLPNKDSSTDSSKKGWIRRLFRRESSHRSSDGPYGFGGPTANAYVLQYIKRSSRDRLYRN